MQKTFASVEDWSSVVAALPVEFSRELPFSGRELGGGRFEVNIPKSHVAAVEAAMASEGIKAIR